MSKRTRFKDCNDNPIYIGDIVHVEEYPGKYVGGSLNFEGQVNVDGNGNIVVTYTDIGESEDFYLSQFSKSGRELLTEEQQHSYWRSVFLGDEPPEKLWKTSIYRNE